MIYRPHPGTYAFDGFPDWLKIIQDRPISDWIRNVDFFVSRRSTSVFEADAAGVPCAMYENPPTPPEHMIPGLDQYPAIRSMKDITQDYIEERKKQENHFYMDYIGIADGHVADRILDAVDRAMDKSYDDENIKQHRKLLINRQSIFLFIIFYMICWFESW